MLKQLLVNITHPKPNVLPDFDKNLLTHMEITSL